MKLQLKFLIGLMLFPFFIWNNEPKAQPAPTPLTPEQKKAVENIITDYIKTNPDVIMKAIETFHKRTRNQKTEQRETFLKAYIREQLSDGTYPQAGNPRGDVTIIEFFDYRCGYCKQVFRWLPALLKEDTNLRFIFIELPILSLESELMSRAAMLVWKYEKQKYFQFHSALMQSRGNLTKQDLLQIAANNGIDSTRISNNFDSSEISKILKQNRDLAQHLGVRGTPAFVVGQKVIPGAIDLKTMKSLIAKKRKKG